MIYEGGRGRQTGGGGRGAGGGGRRGGKTCAHTHSDPLYHNHPIPLPRFPVLTFLHSSMIAIILSSAIFTGVPGDFCCGET